MAKIKTYYQDREKNYYFPGSVVEVDSVESGQSTGLPRWYVVADTDLMLREEDFERC